MSRNSVLESENHRLSLKIDEMKEICTLTSTLNVKYKTQLDRESTEKKNLLETNQKLKLKLNELSTKSMEQQQFIKVLQNNLRSQSAAKASGKAVSSDSDPKTSSEYVDLQTRYDELNATHHEALNVIDELEFELGDVRNICFFFKIESFLSS